MKPGIYKLTQDLPNPMKVDRRRTDWEFREVFEKDSLFIVHEDDLFETAPPIRMLGFRDYSVWTYKSFKRLKPLVDALGAVSEEVDRFVSLNTLILYHKEVLLGVSSHKSIVDQLLAEGTLGLTNIDEILVRASKPGRKRGNWPT
jgi:hypothetical protein